MIIILQLSITNPSLLVLSWHFLNVRLLHAEGPGISQGHKGNLQHGGDRALAMRPPPSCHMNHLAQCSLVWHCCPSTVRVYEILLHSGKGPLNRGSVANTGTGPSFQPEGLMGEEARFMVLVKGLSPGWLPGNLLSSTVIPTARHLAGPSQRAAGFASRSKVRTG